MEFFVSSDPALLDLALIHEFLSNESYWARGVPMEVVERSIANSLSFGVYAAGAETAHEQVGFARVTTDRATSAYLQDIFILPNYRGLGLSRKLMEAILAHPELQGLRRWILATADAHKLYEKFGFSSLSTPDRFMELYNPNVYRP
jgi:GNAT superfamily N-acetyltransferase